MNRSRTLILLRHAKSSWEDSALRDFDRPLNQRGAANAPAMGAMLRDRKLLPQLIISSDAVRALTTARLVATELEYPADRIVTSHALYLSSPSTLLEIADELGNNCDSLMLVAHNPGMTDLANRISDARIDNLPTCGVFAVESQAKRWSQLLTQPGKLIDFLCPRTDL